MNPYYITNALAGLPMLNALMYLSGRPLFSALEMFNAQNTKDIYVRIVH